MAAEWGMIGCPIVNQPFPKGWELQSRSLRQTIEAISSSSYPPASCLLHQFSHSLPRPVRLLDLPAFISHVARCAALRPSCRGTITYTRLKFVCNAGKRFLVFVFF